MTHKERFYNFLSNKSVDQVLFFPDITDWYKARRTPKGEIQPFPTGGYIPDEHPFNKLNTDMPLQYQDFTHLDFYRKYDWGLPVHIYYCYDYDYKDGWYSLELNGIEKEIEIKGSKYFIRLKTNIGTLEKMDMIAADGSSCPREYYAKTVKDLKIIRHIVENTKIIPQYGKISMILDRIGEMGIADIIIGRSPFGKLVHEYMGYENVIYALQDSPEEVHSFLDFQREYDLQMIRLAANSPILIVNISDHSDEHLISPRYYEKYCVPFYQEACQTLHEKGKFVSSHLDGNIKNLIRFLPQTGFDLLDGCTPAPMSNYKVEQLKNGLSNKMHTYCGVPATLFTMNLDDSVILNYGKRIVDTLKNQVILNVGDVLPPNGNMDQVIKLGEWAAQHKVNKN